MITIESENAESQSDGPTRVVQNLVSQVCCRRRNQKRVVVGWHKGSDFGRKFQRGFGDFFHTEQIGTAAG